MEPLEEAPLFVAATRPALVIGLPLGLAVAFLMALALIMILIQNPFYELVLVPLWLLARELVRYDYNAIHVVGLWGQSKAHSFDAHYWGGASPAPFPVRRTRFARPRGIGEHAW